MKRLLTGLATSLLLLTILLGLTHPVHASTQDFDITSFTSEQHLGRTDQNLPTLKIDETIVAVFPSYDQNHGLLRAIPKAYKNQPLDIRIQSITNDSGRPYKYSTSSSNDNLVLKIGDASTYVHGPTTYHISYTLKNPISFPDGHDELYWDVNGTEWLQPINEVTARVHIPAYLASSLQEQQKCFSGVAGSTSQDCTITRTSSPDETVVTTQATNLPAGGNLSYVLAFNKGTFSIDKAAYRAQAIAGLVMFGLVLGLPLAVLILVVYKWRKYGRDSKGRGTIVPQYTPPSGFNALTSDTMLHEKVRNQAITALIIELAIKGVIAIHGTETKKAFGGTKTDYQVEMLKPADGLTAEEQTIHSMLFGTVTGTEARTVNLKDISKKAYVSMQALASSVPKELFTKGYFLNDPAKVTSRYRAWGAGCFVVAMISSFLFFKVSIVFLGLIIGLVLSGIILMIAASKMPARGPKGVEARDYLLGLRDFIQIAEADRLKYLQSPEGVKQWGDPSKPETKVKLFEKLLPYAMIFGLEKGWASEFKDIYQQPPDWYQGNWNTFNTLYLIDSMNSFGTATMASFAPPASSSSSGFSGGFSGGGGGGGGGGGW